MPPHPRRPRKRDKRRETRSVSQKPGGVGAWPGPWVPTRPGAPRGAPASSGRPAIGPSNRLGGRDLAPPRGRTSRADAQKPHMPQRQSPPGPPPRPPRAGPKREPGKAPHAGGRHRAPGLGAGTGRPASPQPGPARPRRPPSRSGPRLTLGPSGGTRGSFHVVVRLLWSTKKGQPVCGSILISQPGGRGSRSPAPLPDALCTMGEWVAALMLARVGPEGLPPGWRVAGCGVAGCRVAGCRVAGCGASRRRVAREPRPELEPCAPPTCPGSRRRAPL